MKITFTKNLLSTLRIAAWGAILVFVAGIQAVNAQTVTWKLTDTAMVGGMKPDVLGTPQTIREKKGTALFFDGLDDGLIIPVNPAGGWRQFTVEVLFKPYGDGPTDPRMVHFEDSIGNRCTIEARITPKGRWYLDTFLKNGTTKKGRTLIDSTILHRTGKWYWAALVFDGKVMTSFVNGKKELQGAVDIPVMTAGNIALGVRLNHVGWFRGQIREIRFHPVALERKRLQR